MLMMKRRTILPTAAFNAETQLLGTQSRQACKHKAVVIGAGPAGALAAMYLAKRGYQVDVFEKRGQTVQSPASISIQPNAFVHTFPMVIGRRGVIGLQEVGAEDLPMLHTTMRGDSLNGAITSWETQISASHASIDDDEFTKEVEGLHSSSCDDAESARATSTGRKLCKDISLAKEGSAAPKHSYIVDRIELGKQMIESASSLYGETIQFHFNQQLSNVDFDRRCASFTPAQKSTSSRSSEKGLDGNAVAETVQYDLLVGADGANSRTQALLKAYDPSLTVEVAYESYTKYKTFAGLPMNPEGPLLLPGFDQHKPSEFIYFYRNSDATAPGVVIYVTPNGTVSGHVNRVKDWEDPALASIIASNYPTIPKIWIQQAVDQMTHQKPSSFGRNIRCSKLHGNRVVLLGDAGHAVTSFLGQGCNMAMESVRIFNKVLDDTGDDLDLAPALYTERRLADVHALQRLEFMESVSQWLPRRPVPALQVAASVMVIKLSYLVSMALNKVRPDLYPAPGYLNMLRDPNMPYSNVTSTVISQAVAGGLVSLLVVAAAVGIPLVAILAAV